MFLSFDLETSGLIGDKKPKDEPPTFITCIGLMDSQGIRQLSAPWNDWNHTPLEAEKFLLGNFDRLRLPSPINVVGTYNGKAFDFPLLEERLKFHGISSKLCDFVHVDEMEYVSKLYNRRVSKDEAALGLADIFVPDTVKPFHFARAYMYRQVTPEIHAKMLQHNAVDLVTTWRFHHAMQPYSDYQSFLVKCDAELRAKEDAAKKESVEAFL